MLVYFKNFSKRQTGQRCTIHGFGFGGQQPIIYEVDKLVDTPVERLDKYLDSEENLNSLPQ